MKTRPSISTTLTPAFVCASLACSREPNTSSAPGTGGDPSGGASPAGSEGGGTGGFGTASRVSIFYGPLRLAGELKEGAIVLGTGGDNRYTAVGDFFEGAITVGYASDATEDAVQANIVGAGYGR